MRYLPGFLLSLLCCVSTSVQAQTAPAEYTVRRYHLDSGELINRAAVEREVFTESVRGGDAPWIRLSFSRAELAPGSRLSITALLDGRTQTLTAASLVQWRNSSAYFNGAEVRLALIAAPGSRNVIEMNRIMLGARNIQPLTQCGPTDDRIASTEPARARLLEIGCSASIVDTQSCFMTAGHCLSSPAFASVVEFNVPPSLPGGGLQHPGPEDQYAVTDEREFVNGGVGNDWGFFKVFPNSETGLRPFEAQGAKVTVSAALPSPPDAVRIVGYGVDSGVDNQTQQESTGPLISVAGNTLSYQADTEGGNSGSAVTQSENDEVIGIHTHGGCNLGSGGNSGTSIMHPSVQAMLKGFCAAGADGVSCADVDRLFARCTASGRTRILIKMVDSSSQGEAVTVAVDALPLSAEVTFGNGAYAFTATSASSGAHTVSLIEPAGCAVPDVEILCP